MASNLSVANFLAFYRHGVLSTLSARYSGYPFGSVVPYDIHSNGSLVIYISRIAEHFKNLTTHPQASLTVTDQFATSDPQAAMRVCSVLDLTAVSESEKSSVEQHYTARFPGSVKHELAHDFNFFWGVPKHTRWIGGFGQMGWLTTEQLALKSADPISYNGWAIASHMNSDHREALQELALAAGHEHKPHELFMDMVTSDGFSLKILESGKTIAIPFPRKAASVEEVRQLVISMLKEVRQKTAQ